MATFDLTKFDGDHIVVHFGGEVTSVDAYTLANALIGFSDTATAISSILDPGQEIEIRVDADGPGSYRTKVKRVKSGLGGFFSRGSEAVFWGLVAAFIYDAMTRNDPQTKVTINTDEVIIENGKDRVIVPRKVYEQLPNVRSQPEARRGVSKIFENLESDPSVTNFGLTRELDDRQPAFQVQRKDFVRLAERPPILVEGEKRRTKTTRARVIILKAWLNHATRKWTFQWNDVPISAPIKDVKFLDSLDERAVLIGSGDALDAKITYQQVYSEQLKMFENDPNTYEITEVVKFIPRFGGKQTSLNVRGK